MLTVNSRIRIPMSELQFTFARSSGPGGQNVNKVNSKAMLRWDVTASPSLSHSVKERFIQAFGSRLTNEGEIVLASQRYRDQSRNVDDCLEKLREMLAAVATAPKRRRPTRPTKASVERRVQQKQKNSQRKSNRQSVRSEE